MSVEFRKGPSPKESFTNLVQTLKTEATHLKSKTSSANPEDLKDPDSDASTNQRLTTVYTEFATKVEALLKEYNRSIVRAINPYLKNISDDVLDAEFEARNKLIESRLTRHYPTV